VWEAPLVDTDEEGTAAAAGQQKLVTSPDDSKLPQGRESEDHVPEQFDVNPTLASRI
jgi:hypothetical protein